MKDHRFQVLDGWRGVCALLVALYHFNAHSHIYALPFFRNAWLFVDFFFVLSGFVITYAYADKLSDLLSARNFVIRRFGRLWPLHAAILACFVLIEATKLALLHSGGFASERAAFSGATSVDTIVSNLLLVHSLGVHDYLTWNTPSWSISTEFYAYLVFAAVCLLTRDKNRLLIAAIFIIIASIAVLAVAPQGMESTYDFGIFRCLYGFYAGHLTYRIWRSGAGASIFARANVLEFAALILAVIFTSLVTHSAWQFASPLVFSLVVWIFAQEKGIVSRMMQSRVAIKLGDFSYSIYMVHALVLLLFGRVEIILGKLLHVQFRANFTFPWDDKPVELYAFGNQWAMDAFTVVYLAAVIAFAAMTHKWIEMPGKDYFNRLASRRQKVSAAA